MANILTMEPCSNIPGFHAGGKVDMSRNTVRVTLDLGPDSQTRLERLQEAFRESKKIEIFRTALQWLEYVVDVHEDGGKIILEDKDGTKRELAVLGVRPSPN